MQPWSAQQLELRRQLPVVVGNADYRDNERRLFRVDEMLRSAGLEQACIEQAVTLWLERGRQAAQEQGREARAPSGKALRNYASLCRRALRCNLARQLVGKQLRPFSLRLAESPLMQWFCGVGLLEVIRVPTKSTLDRYDKFLPEATVRALVNQLNRMAIEDAQRLDLEPTLALEVYLSDTTCVEANIHFPTDWVLLRDGMRTLLKAVKVIRKHGLKHRMPDPDRFLREVNRLSIEMSQSRRRAHSTKRRKTVLRRMKRLSALVKEHAERYSRRLQADWRQETDLREGEVRHIVARMAGVVEQLPAAIRQAHERIIGGRKVPNAEKILSLYEPDVHVIVRNKADAEVEFGNTLLLAEQSDGLILDWSLEKAISPGDVALMKQSLARVKTVFDRYPDVVGADRGFASKANHQWLRTQGIGDAVCPRDPHALTERMKHRNFRRIQRRRAQTEGRIGILKNDFLGPRLRSKGFTHRQLAVAWAVLAHNLWLLARLPQASALQKAA